ncbi:aminoglycoside 6-adenylyltransferase [Nocardia sp. NPDC050793]|uniref:aminoglycoside 6-adenylyltransferase n=1 Tax=Nocardia sp. NPDC050793 TaxID=3155159 RepID=UPI003406A8EA
MPRNSSPPSSPGHGRTTGSWHSCRPDRAAAGIPFRGHPGVDHLNRGELWVAKFRDNPMKECLLQVLEWYGANDQDHPRYTWYIGNHMDEWLPPDRRRRRVHETFGRFDADDARRALDASVDLFAEVAARLGFRWRGELVDGVRRVLAEYRMRR